MAREIKLKLNVDSKTGRTSIKKTSRELKSLGTTGERAAKGLSKAWKTAALAVVAFGTTFLYTIKKCIDSASSLQETTSKFNVVFRGQQKIAEGWAKVLVDSYAMSTREAKLHLSSIQDLLVPMGMVADEAAKLSFEIVKLTADIGSFNDAPTADVMRDVQSALTGEYQTMKKYGVVLNATIIQEKALAMGLAKTKKELTAADKAQATYALTVKGSKAAIGDMARTYNDWANLVKRSKAWIVEIADTIGGPLIDALTPTLKNMLEWVKQNDLLIKQKVKEYAEGAASAIRLFAMNVGLLVLAIKALIFWQAGVYFASIARFVSSTTALMPGLIAQFRALGVAMSASVGLIGGAIGLATLGFIELHKRSINVQAFMFALIGAVLKFYETIKFVGKAIAAIFINPFIVAANKIQTMFTELINRLIEKVNWLLKKIPYGEKMVIPEMPAMVTMPELPGLGEAWEDYLKSLDKISADTQAAFNEIYMAAGRGLDITAAVDRFKEKMKEVKETTDDMKKATYETDSMRKYFEAYLQKYDDIANKAKETAEKEKELREEFAKKLNEIGMTQAQVEMQRLAEYIEKVREAGVAEVDIQKYVKSKLAEINQTALQKWVASAQTAAEQWSNIIIHAMESVASSITSVFNAALNRQQALDDAQDSTQRALEAYNATVGQSAEIRAAAHTRWMDAIEAEEAAQSSLEDVWREYAETFLRDLASMILQQSIINGLKRLAGTETVAASTAATAGLGVETAAVGTLTAAYYSLAAAKAIAGMASRGGGGGGGVTTAAKGGVFHMGEQLTQFATGGIVNRPTIFPMQRGAGLMGEAGPEAVLPLRRGAGGRLGVEAQGGQPTNVNVTYNINAVDAASFAEFTRANPEAIASPFVQEVQRGNANLLGAIRVGSR